MDNVVNIMVIKDLEQINVEESNFRVLRNLE